MKKILFPIAVLSLVFAHERAVCGAFDGLFFGIGAGCRFDKNKLDFNATRLTESQKQNSVFGSLLLGGGKVLPSFPLYLGGEVILDLQKTRHRDFASRDVRITNIRGKHNGFGSSFGFRVGTFKESSRIMLFFKAAIYRSKVNVSYAHNAQEASITNSKVAPLAAVGIECAPCGKYTTRLDLEYKFKSSKSREELKMEKKNSFGMRAALCYNVSF